MNTFSAGASMRVGWETFKKRPWFLIGATIIFLVVVGAISIVLTFIGRGDAALAIALVIVRFLIEMLAVMGILNFSLKAHDDIHAASLMDLWHPRDYWKFLGAIIMQVVLVLAGFLFFIIPGIVVSVAIKLSPYFVIDKHEGPIESIFSSVRITRHKKWAFFQFLILQAVVVFAGFLLLGIGIFVALPVVLIANADAYRTLSHSA